MHGLRWLNKTSCCYIMLVFFTIDGVFHANGQHHKTLEADTVPEAGETEVEKPIDQQEAEEVEEEDETEAGVHQIRTPVQQAKVQVSSFRVWKVPL